jgi:hypothetical protein
LPDPERSFPDGHVSPNGSSERSLVSCFSDASRDLTALVHSEIELAKTELSADVKAAAKGGGLFGAAGFLAVVASCCCRSRPRTASWQPVSDPAVAFLIVAAVYLLIAGILALVGRKQVKRVGPPERTIRTTKESVAALKGGTHAGR